MPFEVTVEDVVPVLPSGIYPATFELVELKTNDTGTYWLWTFLAKSGDRDIEITATTSPRITPRTKAAKFLAGLGQTVAVGQTIELETLFGTVCQIVVAINEQGYSRIESVLPYVAPKVK